MAWTKAKIEKAWRIFMRSTEVIAEALEVTPDELRDLLLEGKLPDLTTPAAEDTSHIKRARLQDLEPPVSPDEILDTAAPILDAPLAFTVTPPLETLPPEAAEAVSALIGKAAEQLQREHSEEVASAMAEVAATGIGMLSVKSDAGQVRIKHFPNTLKAKAKAPSLPISPVGNVPPGVDVAMGMREERSPRARIKTDLAPLPIRKPAGPPKFYLMHEGKYLHMSCNGLTDRKEYAWCQPESKIAAVRRKFPETVDYREVAAL
jgi:hypothetical protein